MGKTMKKLLSKAVFTMSILTGITSISQAAESMELPAPDKKGGIPLMQAIDTRESSRDFSAEALDEQTLSEILWAASGINAKGTLTIPTSRNSQNLKIYALTATGTWLYNPQKHQLELVFKDDIRAIFAKQGYVKDAPLTLVYVGSDKNTSPLHAGSSYQNVGLYAASKKLGAVVRGFYDEDTAKKAMKLKGDDFIIISQTIGKIKP